MKDVSGAMEYGWEGWARDVSLEARLQSMGIAFTVEYIPLDMLDLEMSTQQSGRVEMQLDKDLVTEYACSMLDGDTFPYGAVAWDEKRKLYRILIGNHRAHAARESDRGGMVCYVIATQDALIWSILGRGDNARIGKKTTISERCRSAKLLMDHFGMTQAEAAKINKVEKAIGNFMRAEKVRACLTKAGLPTKDISDGVACELSPILTANPLVCVHAARVVIKHKLTAKEASELSKAVRKESCEDDMLRRVDAFGERIRQLRTAPHRVVKLPKRADMFAWATRGRRLCEVGRTLHEHQITGEPDHSAIVADLLILHEWIGVLVNGKLREAREHSRRPSVASVRN